MDEYEALVLRAPDTPTSTPPYEDVPTGSLEPLPGVLPPEQPTPAECALDWLMHMTSPGGIVADEGEARVGPCIVVDLGENENGQLVYHAGILGPLDKDQQALYCLEREIRPTTPEQRARIEGFQTAVAFCSGETALVPEGEELIPRVNCLKRELAKQREGV